MFCINVALANTVWRLLFKDEARAVEASAELTAAWEHNDGSLFSINDEFGQTMRLRADKIVGVMTEDLDKAKMANVELFLHQQRVQVMAQKAAQTDPGLRASAMMNGPRVLDPMGMQRN